MTRLLQRVIRLLPSFLLSFFLAIAVWVSAVSETDPFEQRLYPNALPIEIVGKDPGLLILGDIPSQAVLTLNAPTSIWNQFTNRQASVRVIADISGFEPGTYEVPVQVQIDARPVEVVSYSPEMITMTLETLTAKEMSVRLIQRGELATGYESENPIWSPEMVTISGPQSLVDQVHEVRAELDLNRADSDINTILALTTVDVEGAEVEGVDISPETVRARMNVTQRGGYRNVVVKVVAAGQVASGYRVTNISVFPPTLTVYSTDPVLVDELPGYVETAALDLNGLQEDLNLRLPLDLPPGVSVVGDQDVAVQVGVDPIEGSVTLSNMPVIVVGLNEGLEAVISPDTVDVIVSGPLPLLDGLRVSDVQVVVDLQDEPEGTYQRVPEVQFVELDSTDLQVESILPASVEIQLMPLELP